MAEDDKDGMDELRLPFVFVPHGAPDPVEFMRICAEPLRIPATFRPDPQPFRPHPDAYLPTGTRTADFPHGTPACLGLIAPGYRPHSRFPHGGPPPYTDPKFSRTDPVAESHRFNQVADEAARNYGSHGIPTASSLAQAGQSTAQLIQAVDEMDAQIRAAIRSLPQNASTIPARLAAQDPPETDEEIGPQDRPLSPQEEINRIEYNVAFDALKTLDPNNPALTTVTGPDYVPDDAAVARIQGVLAHVRRLGLGTAPGEKADNSTPISQAQSSLDDSLSSLLGQKDDKGRSVTKEMFLESLPPNMTMPMFGKLAGFSQGPELSSKASVETTDEVLANLKAAGVSRNAVALAKALYEDQAMLNPSNSSAVHRARLLSDILKRMK